MKLWFYMNGRRENEAFFWQTLEVLATEKQMYMILEGKHVLVDGVEYFMCEAPEASKTKSRNFDF